MMVRGVSSERHTLKVSQAGSKPLFLLLALFIDKGWAAP
jgi:hypothetical protein